MTTEGKRTVKDHGQPKVGDWVLVRGVAGQAMFTVIDPGHPLDDQAEWLPASAVVIPDHYAPIPRPEPMEIGQWVSAFDGAYTGRIEEAQWCESMGRYSYKVVGVGWISPNDFTKVDPPFPSSLSAVGWRPLETLADGHFEQVWMLYRSGGRYKIAATSRRHDENEGRVAWAPIVGSPPVPSDWSPA